jgi:hypothetical protein
MQIGVAMVAVRQDSKSWKQGHAAGLAGNQNKCPPNVDDAPAWYAGYIEGRAERDATPRRIRPPKKWSMGGMAG